MRGKKKKSIKEFETELEQFIGILVEAKTISTAITLLIALRKRGLIILTHAITMMTSGG
jgi:hypothetical protein